MKHAGYRQRKEKIRAMHRRAISGALRCLKQPMDYSSAKQISVGGLQNGQKQR